MSIERERDASSKGEFYPVGLERIDESTIELTWNDGRRQTLTARGLRDVCPCATCREKRTAPPPDPLELPILPAGQEGAMTIAAMRPVGNYAYQVTFGDGHDTGIFTFELLRSLVEQAGGEM